MDSPQNVIQDTEQQSLNLSPIYQKVFELKKEQEVQKRRNQTPNNYIKIQPVNKIDLLLPVDRQQGFTTRKLLKPPPNRFYGSMVNLTKQLQRYQDKKTLITFTTTKKSRKSDRVVNFLKSARTKEKMKTIQKELEFNKNNIERQKEVFTPIRPISKTSRPDRSQISSRSKSQRISENAYSQKIRLQNRNDSNAGSPKKYLRKGFRMRQILLKQLKNQDDIDEQGQLAYMKQYDQWVPASLLARNKLELEHFMNILKGEKVKNKERKELLQPIYL